MALDEFSLIEKFFTQHQPIRKDVLFGVGDDAALLQPPTDQILAITTDTLVAGVHFSHDADPYDIGYKSLAVNLSDLAAMGAMPTWILLALTLPEVNEPWLKKFSAGFFALIKQYNLQLVGGDTTRGPLSITVQALGFVPHGKALRRDGAKVGDRVYVTGTLGDAGLALQEKNYPELTTDERACLQQRLNRPVPRVEVGIALRDIASSAIDISDGLAADLGHILSASNVGAEICLDKIPLSPNLSKHLSLQDAWQLALSAGDDYELCFTVAPENENKLTQALKKLSCSYHCIGIITAKKGLHLNSQTPFSLQNTGFQHF